MLHAVLVEGRGFGHDRPMSEPLRTFGRIKGRPLRAARARLMDERLAALSVDLANPLPGEARETWLEIGFGGGEHLAGQAARHPDVRFLDRVRAAS